MPYSHLASKPAHVARAEDIFYKAVVFAQIQFTVITGHNTCRVLASVLEYGQCVIETDTDIIIRYNTH